MHVSMQHKWSRAKSCWNVEILKNDDWTSHVDKIVIIVWNIPHRNWKEEIQKIVCFDRNEKRPQVLYLYCKMSKSKVLKCLKFFINSQMDQRVIIETNEGFDNVWM